MRTKLLSVFPGAVDDELRISFLKNCGATNWQVKMMEGLQDQRFVFTGRPEMDEVPINLANIIRPYSSRLRNMSRRRVKKIIKKRMAWFDTYRSVCDYMRGGRRSGKTFLYNMLHNQEPIPAEFAKVLEKKFWGLPL